MNRSESIQEISKALIKFRSQVKQPKKNAKNPHFNYEYVTLEGVMSAVDEALEGTGLSYMQLAENDDNGGISISTIITHESGEFMTIGPLTLNPVKRDPQSYGSVITYAKRYQLSAAFGISSDFDDDGNVGNGYGYSNQRPRQSSKQAVNKAMLVAEYKLQLASAEKTLKLTKDEVISMLKERLGEESFENDSQKLKRSIEILKEVSN